MEDRRVLAPLMEFLDPHPNPGNQFGHSVTPLSTGNVVITAPFDDAGGQDAGAVYLFNGSTGDLISTLTGSSKDDNIGISGVVPLTTGNFVIRSRTWDNGTVKDAGAVTFGDGNTGVSGVVGPNNSLVGSSEGDEIGRRLVSLSNGNYVVSSPLWDRGAIVNAGAATFGDGISGVVGEVNATNSLVGSSVGDSVSFDSGGVTALSNGNYLVRSRLWDDGAVANVGAVTFGDGIKGVIGEISASNSLIGNSPSDQMTLKRSISRTSKI